MRTFTSLDALVSFARLRAQRGLYDGRMSPVTEQLILACRHQLQLSVEHGAIVLFTRDVGHHTSGWWKNPDFERCWHLSLSYRRHSRRGEEVDEYLDQDRKASGRIARAFFGDDTAITWCEPPFTDIGKRADVWHYRLFADEGWRPFKPRGEVYDKRNTPAEWRSFSEVHGYAPTAEEAPFFARSST